MIKSIQLPFEVWKNLKISSANNNSTIRKEVANCLDFTTKFKPLLAEVGTMKQGDVFRLDFPDKVVCLKVEDVYDIEKTE